MINVFITGISRGLGLKLTEHYLCKGCRVIGVSRTMSDELESLIEKYSETLEWHQFDLGNLEELEEKLEERSEEHTSELQSRLHLFKN